MIATSTNTGRGPRPVFVVVVLALLVGLTGPASGAGTGGIEITPVPSKRGDKAITTFRVDVPRDAPIQVPYTVRNVEDGPRTARVYSARVLNSDGNFALDEPGSSPHVSMPDRQITLQPGEVLEETFLVAPGPQGPPKDEAYAAVVVEVRNGAVVQRASTLIYLDPGPRVPLPVLLVGMAVALLLIPAGALVIGARRQRQRGDRAVTPDARLRGAE